MQTLTEPVEKQKQPKLLSTQLPENDVPFEVLPHTLSVVYNQGELVQLVSEPQLCAAALLDFASWCIFAA